MRVALCLSGMVRTLAKTYPSLKQCLIDPYKPDVFIHTYDKMGIRDLPVSSPWLTSLLRTKAIMIQSLDDWTPKFRQERDRLYSYPGPVWPLNVAPESRWKLANILAQAWHVNQCDLMRREQERKEAFKYDLVIRARMDNLFSTIPAPLGSQVHRAYPEKTVYFPDHSGYGGICDQYAMGDSNSMSVYADYHLHIEQTYRSRSFTPFRGPTETLLYRYLSKFTDLKLMQFHFPFELQRETGIEYQSHKTPEFYEKYIATGIAE
ncbi:MAG TPA: hypothetical protein VGL56_19040 [Fimbriimonadaceae bacterium]|jgi:hypothetical protein